MPKHAFFNLPEEKKNRVRQAAVDLFGSMPYEEVTTRLLVREAGIPMGSLYQYFDSKDEMYCYFIDEEYMKLYRKGSAEDILNGKLPEYRAEKDFIDSMFFAPGFYTGESYEQAVSFVSGFENPLCIYFNLSNSYEVTFAPLDKGHFIRVTNIICSETHGNVIIVTTLVNKLAAESKEEIDLGWVLQRFLPDNNVSEKDSGGG